MKIMFKALAVVILAGIGSASVLWMWDDCPQRKANEQDRIDLAIKNYVDQNSDALFEKIAKSEKFGNTVRNLASAQNDEIKEIIENTLSNNHDILNHYLENNADYMADKILENEKFKSLTVAKADSQEENQNAENDANKIYKDHWDELKNHPSMPFIGPKDAKITVVEFFDFACGHCKALAPVMDRLVKDNSDVKFVFAPLYFMSEHSPYAAKTALAAYKKGKFIEVFEGLLTLPDMNEKTINQILVDEGLNLDEIKKMIDKKDIRRGIQDIDSLSQVLGVNGVPLLLINGEAYYGRSLTDLQNKLNSLK